MGKLSMPNFSGFIICLGSIFQVFIKAEVIPFFVHVYYATPTVIPCIPKNAFESTFIIRRFPSVHIVLTSSTFPQIFLAIIQAIQVYMVNFFIFGSTKDFSFHRYMATSPICSKFSGSVVPKSYPIKFRYSFKVFSINKGILSTRQGDYLVGLVKGLADRVAFHAVFWHRFTSNGPLLPTPILA
jgi:hypothetical protein